MTYRNEQDANADRTRARIARMREELEALEAEVGAQPKSKLHARGWIAFGVLIASINALVLLSIGGFVWMRSSQACEPVGAPDSPLAQLDRRTIDAEFERLHGEMQACAPEGFVGRIQSDVIFEGSTGEVHHVDLRNEGTTTLELGMMDCVEQTYQRISASRFRADQYRYRRTLIWNEGVLTSE